MHCKWGGRRAKNFFMRPPKRAATSYKPSSTPKSSYLLLVRLLHDTSCPGPQADLCTVHLIVANVSRVRGRFCSTLDRVGRAALHTIHGLFPPPAQSGHVGGKDPISLKKLEAGDTQYAHIKELLGFVFDGQAQTVHLTQRKALGISDATTRLLKKYRVATQKFQSVVGKTRHVATILPSARALFTPLNRAL